jgi:hypothetical protein
MGHSRVFLTPRLRLGAKGKKTNSTAYGIYLYEIAAGNHQGNHPESGCWRDKGGIIRSGNDL